MNRSIFKKHSPAKCETRQVNRGYGLSILYAIILAMLTSSEKFKDSYYTQKKAKKARIMSVL